MREKNQIKRLAYMDWKTIKELLRLYDEEFDNIGHLIHTNIN